MKGFDKIRLYGAGGHSQIIQAVSNQNGVTVTAVFDDNTSGSHPAFKNIISGARKNPDKFPHTGDPFIIAVGDNSHRVEISKFLKSEFATVIHKSAIIDPNVSIGKGTVIYAGAAVQPNTIIGEHVIINTLASVDHDNIIEDFVHVSPNATLCGLVHVGEGTHIGAGAVIIPKIKIGKWCTIGAGAVIIRDVPDYSVVVGNPGKVIKTKSLL
ncbi:acetyltransferase [Aquimarina gracilis]|uniref:Acetyltransferase n=1 Tax=Aquimarina gracilis TaxID=874422 RepID=A0ABU5ZUP4_9FLAO|nr:acetyltransferase [Aquimarina gracilis]MEB3345807.1 acetyltransferase [Aquimarina gracilis]